MMNKSTIIGIVIVIALLAAAVAWKYTSDKGGYGSKSWFEYGSQDEEDEDEGEMMYMAPEQGVDDIASEADSSAQLDSSIDSDLQELDKELQGL